MIVLRALAKSPEDRFQTAEEMDAELERVAKGVGVTAETADAATYVLSGSALANAPTAVVPPRRPPAAARPSYRYADAPARRRPFWPWLLALLLVVAAGVAGWYAFGKIQHTLNGSGSVSVPNVVPLREDLAVQRLASKGLKANVHRRPNEDPKVNLGSVYEQNPVPGSRQDKGSAVDIFVSLGPPQVKVPDVKGNSRDQAISTLSGLGLKVKIRDVFSKETGNTVIAQFPLPDAKVDKGSTVQINVSKGLQPLTVPDVRGQQYDNAAGTLQGEGFAVARRDVESVQPKDVVIDQKPAGGTGLARGGTVTLYVSKGPKQSTIPDVTSQDEASAQADARAVGLRRRRAGSGHDRPEPGRDRALPGSAGRHEGQARLDGHDHRRTAASTKSVMPKVRVAVVMGGRSSEHEISLASAHSVLAAARPGPLRGRDGRDRPRRALGARLGHARRAGAGRALGRGDPSGADDPGPGDAFARWTSSSRSSTGRSARTAPSRGCSSSQTCRTWAPACSPRRSAWTRTSSSRCSATRGFRLRRASPFARRRASRTRSAIPVFVKPARLGSSVGITKARGEKELQAGIELAFRHDEKVLVEEFVSGVEVECSVLGNEDPIASIPGEIVANSDWYDYSAKYDEGGMDLIIPPRVPQEAIDRVQELSVAAFRATECEGMARADCFVRDDGEVLINELNTIPGFTATSVYAKLFEASGIPYEELLDRLVQLALERHERRARLKF